MTMGWGWRHKALWERRNSLWIEWKSWNSAKGEGQGWDAAELHRITEAFRKDLQNQGVWALTQQHSKRQGWGGREGWGQPGPALQGGWWDVGRVPRALPIHRMEQGKGRSGKRHQSQQRPWEQCWWSRAGGTSEEEKGCADSELKRCWVCPELPVYAGLGTEVTNRSLTTDRVQPQAPCTQTEGWVAGLESREHRGKGEAEEGLDFFAFKRFYSQWYVNFVWCQSQYKLQRKSDL